MFILQTSHIDTLALFFHLLYFPADHSAAAAVAGTAAIPSDAANATFQCFLFAVFLGTFR